MSTASAMTANGHAQTNGHLPELAQATSEGRRPDGAVVLVTGASKGIGAAIARELAADGWA